MGARKFLLRRRQESRHAGRKCLTVDAARCGQGQHFWRQIDSVHVRGKFADSGPSQPSAGTEIEGAGESRPC